MLLLYLYLSSLAPLASLAPPLCGVGVVCLCAVVSDGASVVVSDVVSVLGSDVASVFCI